MAVLEGSLSANQAEVDAGHNLNVTLPNDSQYSGFAKILDTDGRGIVTTENEALSVSMDNLLFIEQVDGSAININKWATSTDTMTVTQSSGFIILNANSTTTANKYAILSSTKYLPFYGHLPIRISINAKVPVQPQANLTMELGIGTATTNGAPTDGAFFRWNSSTEFRAVINNAGVETSTLLTGTYTDPDGDSISVPPSISVVHLYDIVVVEDIVQFFIDDVKVAEVNIPAGQAFPTNAGRLPLFARVYNGGSAPGQAPQISIGQVGVVQEGMVLNRPISETLASLGNGAYQSPVTAFAQTANHANSTSPTSATLSNTAAGYTTLGGRYQFAAVASAATDFALFAYQVPTGYQFYVTGVTITCANTGAIGSAITPSIFDWSIGVNSSAVSLATTDGAGTWAPRRIPLGIQSFALSVAIGSTASDLVRTFTPAIVCDSGRYLHIILQVPSGASTASEIFRGDVLVTGYFE